LFSVLLVFFINLITLLLLLVLLSVAGIDKVLALTLLFLLGCFVDDLLVLSLHEHLLLLESGHLVGFLLGRWSTVASGVKAGEVVVEQDTLARLNLTTAATNRLFVFGASLLR
jgi:hypothetical protein